MHRSMSTSSSSSSSSPALSESHGPYLEDIYPPYPPPPQQASSSSNSNSSFGRGWSSGSLFAEEDENEEFKREREVIAEHLYLDSFDESSAGSGDKLSDEDRQRLDTVQRGQ